MKFNYLKLTLLVLLVSLVPAGTASAHHDDDGNSQFYGTISSLPPSGLIGNWVVGGRTVHVTAATRIEQKNGPVVVGAYVQVKGWLQADGSVNATKVEVKRTSGRNGRYAKFYGIVEQLPADGLIGDWIVSGRTVRVSTITLIDQRHGAVSVGAYVEVKGIQQADGSVNATKVEVKR